ncbi:MAG: spore gernimation protein [Firmicutes bacterium]|nr:spore gernimation protein [Bacillota bacterium]
MDLHIKLIANIEQVKQIADKNSDWVIRSFICGKNRSISMAVAYIQGLADKNYIQQMINDLTEDLEQYDASNKLLANQEVFEYIQNLHLSGSNFTEVTDFDKLCQQLLSGDTIIMLDGLSKSLALSSGGSEGRSISSPSSQGVLRGPQEGFVEKLATNKTLIRKIIKDSRLQIENKVIGRVTKTSVAVVYVKGICDGSLVKKVNLRLERIAIDGILESGNIEELIQDRAFSIFPTVLNTERPDTVAAELLNGRIAILVDGTPFVLIVPAVFVQFFQASEDYYNNYIISSLIRVLRYTAFLLTLFVPALYIALTTFHNEMIPTVLLINIAAQAEGTPFPTFIEALLLEAIFEIFREASIRMPKAIGSAISMVGGLVMGQAAVQAGIVSEGMLIVVGLTAMSSFILPHYNMSFAVRILRFVFMVLAASFGLFGIFIGLMGMLFHLCSLRSLGVPYMEPLSPRVTKTQRDAILRLPLNREEAE